MIFSTAKTHCGFFGTAFVSRVLPVTHCNPVPGVAEVEMTFWASWRPSGRPGCGIFHATPILAHPVLY